MVAAFASENGLATLVGTRTAGRLVAASAYKIGEGYRVVLVSSVPLRFISLPRMATSSSCGCWRSTAPIRFFRLFRM
jgi:hypothetical protein